MGLRAPSLSAQSRSQLESERLNIIRKIEEADKLLSRNSASQKATLQDFRTLETKIRNREKLVSSIQNELILAEQEMEVSQAKTVELREDLDSVKHGYYDLLNEAYKQKLSVNRWAYILNSKSINDSFQRWKYIQQYEAYTKGLYQNIISKNEQLKIAMTDLNADIADRQSLLDEEKNQFEQIKKELTKKDELLQELKSQESDLIEDLNSSRKERESLNSAIESVIISALKGENSTDATKVNNSSGSFDIASARGKLPWPVENGQIISYYGKQRHPTLKDVYVNNNGIDIQVQNSGTARAVYRGQVVGVSTMPGFGKTVIVRHGSYYSVYAKLRDISVYDDQYIEQGDIIGSIALNPEGIHVFHFEFWEGKKKWDPALWIKK